MVVVQQLSLRQQPVFSLEWTLFWKHLWTEAPYKVPASPAPMGPFSSAALSVLWTSWHWCLGTCPCTPRSQGAILTLRSKWWLTGLGFAAFLVKLCQEQLNGEGWRRDDAPLWRVCLYATGVSLVKNTSQRGRVIELTANSPAKAGSLGLCGEQDSQPFASFSFRTHLKVSIPEIEIQFNVFGLID